MAEPKINLPQLRWDPAAEAFGDLANAMSDVNYRSNHPYRISRFINF